MKEDSITDGEKLIIDSLKAVPISAKTRQSLNGLNIDVQQFLIRFMDVRDIAVRDEVLEKVGEFVLPWSNKLDIIIDNQKLMQSGLKDIVTETTSIKQKITAMDERLMEAEEMVKLDNDKLKKLDKIACQSITYRSIKWTLIRNLVTAIFAIAVSVWIAIQFDNKRSQLRDAKEEIKEMQR